MDSSKIILNKNYTESRVLISLPNDKKSEVKCPAT